jgi:hypothetical protein
MWAKIQIGRPLLCNGERQLRICRLSPARFPRDPAASTEEEV